MTPPGPPPAKQIGSAHPTCPRCGKRLEIKMEGEPDPEFPDDLVQIHFTLPARHSCRPRPGAPIDLREARPPATGAC